MESESLEVNLNVFKDTCWRFTARSINRRRCIRDEIATGLATTALIILWLVMFPSGGQARPESMNHQPVPAYSSAVQSYGFPRILAQ